MKSKCLSKVSLSLWRRKRPWHPQGQLYSKEPEADSQTPQTQCIGGNKSTNLLESKPNGLEPRKKQRKNPNPVKAITPKQPTTNGPITRSQVTTPTKPGTTQKQTPPKKTPVKRKPGVTKQAPKPKKSKRILESDDEPEDEPTNKVTISYPDKYNQEDVQEMVQGYNLTVMNDESLKEAKIVASKLGKYRFKRAQDKFFPNKRASREALYAIDLVAI